jgi:hypothetical protein
MNCKIWVVIGIILLITVSMCNCYGEDEKKEIVDGNGDGDTDNKYDPTGYPLLKVVGEAMQTDEIHLSINVRDSGSIKGIDSGYRVSQGNNFLEGKFLLLLSEGPQGLFEADASVTLDNIKDENIDIFNNITDVEFYATNDNGIRSTSKFTFFPLNYFISDQVCAIEWYVGIEIFPKIYHGTLKDELEMECIFKYFDSTDNLLKEGNFSFTEDIYDYGETTTPRLAITKAQRDDVIRAEITMILRDNTRELNTVYWVTSIRRHAITLWPTNE